VNCDSQDSFSTIWHKALRELKVSLEKRSMGFLEKDGKEQVRLENYLPETVHPEDVRYLLERAGNTIIVFDEIDRMSDKSATTLLADTIKTLSDHLVKATLVLVGVADSVEELLAEHRSIERSLKQVQMPRMSAEELAEILEKCLAQVKMKIKGKAKERIAQLSQGMPHYTHLLGLHAAQAAVDADRNTVTKKDVEKAIRLAVENAQHGMLSAYLKAVSSPKKNLYAQVLLACALTPTDELGYFAPAQVRAPLSSVLGKSVEIATFAKHLNEFCESERGAALQRSGSSRNYRYRFSNPMMQPFVVMNGLSKGWITEDILERTASERT
jgi:Cdc6-like AAA superfamily ATPase